MNKKLTLKTAFLIIASLFFLNHTFASVVLVASKDTTICKGDTAKLYIVSSTGGYGTHSWLWSNGDTGRVVMVAPTETTTYTVTATASICGCKGYAAVVVTVNNCLSGIETLQEDGIKTFVYPNPVNDLANVEFNLENQGNIQLSVFDQLGQKVYFSDEYRPAGRQKISLNTSSLREGIYFLRVSSDGQNGAVYRFVKMK